MSETIDSMETVRVLYAEDDTRLARLTATYLEMRGLLVTVVHDGLEAIEEASRNTYDAILLDLMLPGATGQAACKAIRARSDVPIIMVTALGEVDDRVYGLNLGADDYLPKPFSAPELHARILAAVRRYRGRSGPTARTLELGPLFLDPGRLVATLDGQELDLTAYEFSILRVLAESAGRALSRERILDLAKGNAEEAFERSIDGHVSRLRKKLSAFPGGDELIKTIRGAGYLLAPPADTP